MFTIFMSSKEVFEREIQSNIDYLKQEEWFKIYFSDDTYHPLIDNNKRVRRIIGLINVKKMSKSTYHDRKRKKIESVIHKQAK